METQYKQFITTFYKFIYDLNRYNPTPETQQNLEIYNDLDMAQTIFKTYNLLKDNGQQITEKDETLFDTEFMILNNINLSAIWKNLIKGQKNKVWTYLNILKICSELLNEDKPVETDIVKKDFNPYEGIGGDTEFTVEGMCTYLDNLDDGLPGGIGIESIAKLIGLDKYVNMEELRDKLKGMTKEQIDSATNDIRGMLGGTDDKTAGLINKMLTGVNQELQNTDLSNENPLTTIMKMAEKVAHSMKDDIKDGNIDMNQIFNSTQNLAGQMKDENGNPVFGAGNPFMMLGKMINMSRSTTNNTMSQEQCKTECNQMLQSMGMENVDLDNPNMANMMQGMMRANSRKQVSKRRR
jgi:hypothetical protein